MNKETLRMQMLAGVITESQYKQRLNEGRNMDELENLVQNNFQTIKDNFIKSELENLEDIEFDEDWEKEDAIEDLHDQMDISEAIDLILAINERSLGYDLSDEDDVKSLHDDILKYI